MKKPESEESRCDQAIAQMFGASAIIRFGRKGKRTANAEGVPDRLYLCGARMVWFEVKSATDYLSPAQVIFLHNVLERDGVAGCGNREDLLTLLNAPNYRPVALAQIERYRTRAGR